MRTFGNDATLFHDLPHELRIRFLEAVVEFEVKAGDIIYEAGEKPKGVYFTLSGFISLVVANDQGAERLVRFFRSKELFGYPSFLGRDAHDGEARALVESRVGFIPEHVVEWALDASYEFRNLVIQKLVDELKVAETGSVHRTDFEVLERVAVTLVYLNQVDPDHQWSNAEIAAFSATDVSTISKMLTSLEAAELIKCEGSEVRLPTDSLREALILRKLTQLAPINER